MLFSIWSLYDDILEPSFSVHWDPVDQEPVKGRNSSLVSWEFWSLTFFYIHTILSLCLHCPSAHSWCLFSRALNILIIVLENFQVLPFSYPSICHKSGWMLTIQILRYYYYYIVIIFILLFCSILFLCKGYGLFCFVYFDFRIWRISCFLNISLFYGFCLVYCF